MDGQTNKKINNRGRRKMNSRRKRGCHESHDLVAIFIVRRAVFFLFITGLLYLAYHVGGLCFVF